MTTVECMFCLLQKYLEVNFESVQKSASLEHTLYKKLIKVKYLSKFYTLILEDPTDIVMQ